MLSGVQFFKLPFPPADRARHVQVDDSEWLPPEIFWFRFTLFPSSPPLPYLSVSNESSDSLIPSTTLEIPPRRTFNSTAKSHASAPPILFVDPSNVLPSLKKTSKYHRKA